MNRVQGSSTRYIIINKVEKENLLIVYSDLENTDMESDLSSEQLNYKTVKQMRNH